MVAVVKTVNTTEREDSKVIPAEAAKEIPAPLYADLWMEPLVSCQWKVKPVENALLTPSGASSFDVVIHSSIASFCSRPPLPYGSRTYWTFFASAKPTPPALATTISPGATPQIRATA